MANKYKLRDGVVLTTVCGETLLLATRKVRDTCPYTLHLDDASKYLLALIENSSDKVKMTAEISARFNLSEELALRNLESFISAMEEYGVIVPEECE